MAVRRHQNGSARRAGNAQQPLAPHPRLGRRERPRQRLATHIVYRNHAATKWFHEALGERWEVVAQYIGDKLTTILNHYVRDGEDTLRDSIGKLAKF